MWGAGWLRIAELWEEVSSEQEFEALLNQQSDKLLLVDFWGKTCKGCEAVYLQLCRVADDQALRKKVKFVKVCVDGMVDRTKAEGVRALPYVAFYRGEQGKLGGSTTNPTQAKHFRKNIQTVLDNPGKIFNQDPNGFWVARDPPTKEATELKAQQLAKMEEQTKQMRKHLLGEYFGDVKR
ncbi:hypothetical protein WJX84_007126 [Apatococcus fuscideae]|uniref:Thioredoxin domain-containing protein n=1 Tax=Apatococcus fuscideae TaxID=2026836 RepID=A0AAW1SMY5_9CHLO